MKAIHIALFAPLALAGCASLQVRTDYDPQVSFAELRAYDWSNQTINAGGNPAVNSTLVERRIQRAVDSTLGRMGYERVTTATPDFRVTYQIYTELKWRVNPGYGYGSYGYGGYGHFGHGSFGHRGFGHGHSGFGYGHSGFGYGSSYGSSLVYEYVETTLVLDVADARTNELIWRGWATGALDQNPTPNEVQKFVSEAVEKILEEFPRAGLGLRPNLIAS